VKAADRGTVPKDTSRDAVKIASQRTAPTGQTTTPETRWIHAVTTTQTARYHAADLRGGTRITPKVRTLETARMRKNVVTVVIDVVAEDLSVVDHDVVAKDVEADDSNALTHTTPYRTDLLYMHSTFPLLKP